MRSCIIYFLLFFFLTKNIGAIWDNFENLTYSFLNCSSMNSHTSPLSSLDNKYNFFFFCIDFFFISITWFHSSFFGILSLSFFLSKDMNLFVESLRYQFLQILLLFSPHPKSSNPLLPSLLLLFPSSLGFSSFSFLFYFSIPFLLISFLLLSFSLSLFTSVILTSSTSVSTVFHILLDISSSLPLLSSSQFQDCSKQAMIFPKSHSISDH